jgi:6-phosphogluconolactonase
MRTRFTWVLGILALISIGLLIACGTKYSSSNNGLVVVPSQGFAVMQTFSLNLNNGGISEINNAAGPPTPGLPSAVVLDPAGTFAYVIVTQNSQITPSTTGIAVFPVGSDGKLGAASSTAPLNPVGGVPAVPVALAIDSAGKYLFVADGTGGVVSVLAIGSGGALSEVSGSPFPVPAGLLGPADLTALAVSPTMFPALYAACSQQPAPASENLYVTDSKNDTVWEFGVSSSGALGNPPGDQSVLGFPTGTVPSGIAIDPCNRFVYVADSSPNNEISAYTICNAVLVGTCSSADGSLVEVSGSPFADQGIAPGPMTEDAYGKFLYVVNTSGSLAGYTISPVTGGLTAFSAATVATGSFPVAIAVRSDDSWLFVANSQSANVSQYSITPASGQLSPLPAFTTANNPFGVAVK